MKIKQGILLALFIMLITGCTRREQLIDEDKNQLIEITAGAENKVYRQITDNALIFEIIHTEEIENWEDLKELPVTAVEICKFTSYEEITEPAFLKEGKPWINRSCMVLYADAQSEKLYYAQETDPVSGQAYFSFVIPRAAGEYLKGLAAGDFEVTDRESIMKSWSAGTGDIYDANEDFKEAAEELYDDYDKYPFQDVEAFDEKGLKKASRVQQLQIYTVEDDVAEKEAGYVISDLKELADFYNQLNMQKWERVNAVPEGGKRICLIVRYALPKKSFSSKLIEEERMTLYKDTDCYYILSFIPGDKKLDLQDEESCYKIPSAAGLYLKGLTPFAGGI